MPGLRGNKVYLRALEPEDLDFVHTVENIEEFWEVSATQTPYSRFLIKQYLENAHRDIYDIKQLRLVICDLQDNEVGLIDIFDFEPKDRRAALGILIADPSERGKGYGAEALKLLCNYCFTHLAMHQVYANITEGNETSVKLFENLGFQRVGIKKDWTYSEGGFKDEILYQLINK
ncbi:MULTISPECIES: GNAT family N-acetyltransferase [Salegentibacter]|jgi:diamine N-acetyltransferase|uniref:Diamine N-acetyltransferase n=1 Tax=Salegentibacter agarivorans TaxID=345907 RepID=A0A1I2L2X5_9FLAO|nr:MULTISPECIES: GNAT family N-acetyltransferase [Salegentibacter]APS40394.1 acetyltransferase [Salegentibacter sp. T436]SFF72840.1 diamine N-acetyltransferase [Salegentibacter agarivorans]